MAIQRLIRQGKEWGTRIGANLAYLYALSEVGERLPPLSSATEALLAGGAALTMLPLNRYVITPFARKMGDYRPLTRQGRTALAGGLAMLLGFSGYGLRDDAEKVFDDVRAIVQEVPVPEITEDLETVLRRNKELSAPADSKLPDYSTVQLAERESTLGRTQRVLRWKPLADAVEKKYHIPSGTLKVVNGFK